MAGVAVVSTISTPSSPMITPEFGSPSAVYAYAFSDSWVHVTFLTSRSAWDANAFAMLVSLESWDVRRDRPRLRARVLEDLSRPVLSGSLRLYCRGDCIL